VVISLQSTRIIINIYKIPYLRVIQIEANEVFSECKLAYTFENVPKRTCLCEYAYAKMPVSRQGEEQTVLISVGGINGATFRNGSVTWVA
jgi:hypothetical protein